MAGAEGVIRGPADGGRVAMVARDDIADVAVAVLLGAGHERVRYDITGAVLHTMAEYAAELAEVSGRAVTFEDETIEQAWQSRSSYGAPDWEVEGWITSYTSIASGELAVVSDTVQRLAGHPPTTLHQLVERDPSFVALP
jgi:NAD(P)H dehydrogenase (quinone)